MSAREDNEEGNGSKLEGEDSEDSFAERTTQEVVLFHEDGEDQAS
jgi:hypothetical protein